MGLENIELREIAQILAEQAQIEANRATKVIALGIRCGMSRSGINEALDDIRRRHDCILMARELVLNGKEAKAGTPLPVG